MKTCQVCFKPAKIVKKRIFKVKNITQPVTSQKEMCSKCNKNLIEIFKKQ